MTLEQQQIIRSIVIKEIEKGLDFILSHFNQERLFPRKIQTCKSEGRQIQVFSKQEALSYFEQSNFLDCRINGYPSYTEYKGIQRYPPDFIFIDLDRKDFKDDRSFENALSKTKKNIKEKLNGVPSVYCSGNGYHILQPIECPILEEIEEFQRYKDKFLGDSFSPSQEFLRFAKDFLSNNKADKCHYPSFKSCQIRIPNSINSKCLYNREKRLNNNFRVKTLQEWNGVRVPITREFIEDFRTHLEQKVTDQENNNNYNYKNNNNSSSNINSPSYYKWIEQILQTPLEDCRKIIVDLILSPYLINIKKLSYDDSYQIIRKWLDHCNTKKELDRSCNFNYRINYALKTTTRKGIIPLGQYKIKSNSNYANLSIFLKKNQIF